MNIFALPQCHKQQECQNFLYCIAGAIPPTPLSFQYQFPHCPSSSYSQFPLKTRTVSGKRLQIRKMVYLFVRQSGFESAPSTKLHKKCWRGSMYFVCVLNAEINITRGGNDKCWIKRCTGKGLRDFRGERKFFFFFSGWIQDMGYRDRG